MKTKKPNNRLDILNETAVFDYVAGHMSEERCADFESILAQNDALRELVDAERLLRAEISKLHQNDSSECALGDDSIDKLFTKLDELDDGTAKRELTNPVFISTAQAIWASKQWFGVGAVAASVMLAVVLFYNNQTNTATHQYDLLSDESQIQQIEFTELVAAKKIAQVWLSNDLTAEQVSTVLNKYRLTPIGRAGQAWVVASEQVLSAERLSSLKAASEFGQVSVISYTQ